jgi:hypothetical protein
VLREYRALRATVAQFIKEEIGGFRLDRMWKK